MAETAVGREVVRVEGLEALLRRIPDQVQRRSIERTILTRLAIAVEAEAKRRAPSRTATLRRSIRHVVDPSGAFARVDVDPTVRYGLFVEKGTGVYGPKGQRIYPKHAKALRWAGNPTRLSGTGGGQFVFARSIAGMRPQPFLMPAWEQVRATRVEAELARAAHAVFGPEKAIA